MHANRHPMTQRRFVKTRAVRVGVVVGLLAGLPFATARAQTGTLAELKRQFNADRGVPRLIVLASPT